ncbi:MAG: histidinol dehydrogenase [Bacteroides sp.]|jgi:histidinol dehydrogenase|nr:histidinol dehydrogenase [Bacteroides sp.]
MSILKYHSKEKLAQNLQRPLQHDPILRQRVQDIIRQVQTGGDESLFQLSRELDRFSGNNLEVTKAEMNAASELVTQDLKDAIALARQNIERFHAAQMPADISLVTQPGVFCSMQFRPLQRVGLYIPGGTAPLLSTVLMLAVPALVAGCKELIICTPPEPAAELLYTLSLFNARVFRLGGAQAIAAMAFGTQTVPKVDKIFGPGNRYVTEAKVQLGAMGIPIDMPAGPSEVLVIADESANPSFVAADLLSQAEHGTDSQVVLLTTSEEIMTASMNEVNKQLSTLPRREIAAACLEKSTAILVKDLSEAIEISNEYAPEHLILAVKNPAALQPKVENAGSVFMGHFTPESLGDYSSGTNHTLPTSGFARNWSGVNLLSFMKTITFQEATREGLERLAGATSLLARAEGLEAHARAVEVRQNPD